MKKLRIALATSEIAPFAKSGGLADVSAALPAKLKEAGHDVRVFVPFYSSIDVDAYEFNLHPDVQDVSLHFGPVRIHFSLFQTKLPGSDVTINFVHCPRLYDRDGLYTDAPDEPIRFALLSRAVLECCQREQWAPDIIQCNDWQTALIPTYLKSLYAWDKLFAPTRTVLAVHNLGYQGIFPAKTLDVIGFAEAKRLFDKEDYLAGKVNFLKTGLMHADRLSTVSPTYAEEIQTETYGFGLHELLTERSDDLTGILNGVDGEIWNPRTDKNIAARYSAKSLYRKEKAKVALLADLSLPYEKGVPVIGMITRLAGQKGVNLLEDSMPEILKERDLRFVVLGSGEPPLEEFFAELQEEFPDKVCFYRGFHAKLAHEIEAGSDMFLMPSLYEPCGLNQMYSLAYATVPVVRKTGGLADTVTQFDPETGEGNGIVFEHPTSDGVRWAVNTALDLYADEKNWKLIRKNGIEGADFSWDRAAASYAELYQALSAETKDPSTAEAEA